MNVAYKIFGNKAFRKYYGRKQSRPTISKPLFDIIAVNIDSLTYEEQDILVQKSLEVNRGMERLFKNDDEFDEAIRQGSSSSASRLRYRFSAVKDMFREVLDEEL